MVLPASSRLLQIRSPQSALAPRRKNQFQLQSGGGKDAGRSGRHGGERRYRAGETVIQSGIYEVIHDSEHRVAHEVVMISGESFPDCETCKENVRFRLIRTAPYIFQDEDFEEGSN